MKDTRREVKVPIILYDFLYLGSLQGNVLSLTLSGTTYFHEYKEICGMLKLKPGYLNDWLTSNGLYGKKWEDVIWIPMELENANS